MTALFRFECDPECEVQFVTQSVGGPGPAGMASVSIVQQDGWYVLAPDSLFDRQHRLDEIETQRTSLLDRIEKLPPHPWGKSRT